MEYKINKGFKTVNPYDFYRDLFPKGSLQNKDESFNNYNYLQIYYTIFFF